MRLLPARRAAKRAGQMTKRIVVTGVGLVSALGIGTEENWKAVLAGVSGVAPITHFDA